MRYDPGLNVEIQRDPMGFAYGAGVYGPKPEYRSLEAIRPSLLDPQAQGPETVYAIAMDVAKEEHRPALDERMLLFGVVTYAAGLLGKEPVRSQGHVHALSKHSQWSPPELYEIWEGKAIVYMQEKVEDKPGPCYAVYAEAGSKVLVPPRWAHCAINADPSSPMTFAAWCDREYSFKYDEVRAYHGLAWYPLVEEGGAIQWKHNPRYKEGQIICKESEDYGAFGIEKDVPIYVQFEKDLNKFQFISKPGLVKDLWDQFIP